MAEIDLGSALRGRLTALDSTFLYAETADAPMHIGGLMVLEGALPFDKFTEFVRQRLAALPQLYVQRLAEVPFDFGYPMLEDDPDFRLENHLKRYQIPAGMNKTDATRYVMSIYQAQLDRKHPLWELLSFEGWGGRDTCLVSKIHHSLVDGVSSIELLKVLMDDRPDAPPPPPAPGRWKPTAMRRPLEKLIDAARDRMIQRIDAMSAAFSNMVRNPAAITDGARQMFDGLSETVTAASRPLVATPWNGGLVGGRRDLAWVNNSFRDYRAIRQAFGGTVNDIVVTVLTEAAARYLNHHGYSTDGFLRLGCPVSVRRSDEQTDLGNRVSMMFPTIPAAPMDVVERHKVVREEIDRIKAAGLAQALADSTELADLTPAGLMAAAGRLATIATGTVGALARMTGWRPRPNGFLMPPPGIHFVATNVPGVQVPLYLAGHRLIEEVGMLPLGANLGYGVAIVSYNGELVYGLVADPELVPDLALMKAYVEEAVEELKSEAAKHVVGEEHKAAA